MTRVPVALLALSVGCGGAADRDVRTPDARRDQVAAAPCHTALAPLTALAAPIAPVGAYSNLEVTETGHASGYTVELWWDGDELLGLLGAQPGGLAGDTPAGELADLVFDPVSCAITFHSRLAAGMVLDAGSRVPTQDVVRFHGTLRADTLAGLFAWTEQVAGTRRTERGTLVRSAAAGALVQPFGSRDDFRRHVKTILDARGPAR